MDAKQHTLENPHPRLAHRRLDLDEETPTIGATGRRQGKSFLRGRRSKRPVSGPACRNEEQHEGPRAVGVLA